MKQLALSAALLACSLPTMANSFLGNVDIEDLIGLIAVLLLFSTPIIIVAITFWFNHRNKKAKYQVISEALAAGKDLPKEFFVEPSKNSDPTAVLSKGIKNACLGIGLAIMIWFMTEEMGIASIGILIFFIGIGQVITAYATREKEEGKNEPSNCTDIEQL